jgi:putative redox protein
MVKMTVRYDGDLRCTATHGPSGSRIETDAPVDNQGRGERFSPTDLVATALATCMTTVLGIAARKKGWDLKGMEVDVAKEMTPPPRRIAKLAVEIRMPVALPDADREEVRRLAATCPVALSIGDGVGVPLAIHWPA